MIRLLVVDDEKTLLDMLKYVLESNDGFVVDTAESADQALSFLSEHEYDIIISDYNMPEVTGIDLLKQIRSMNNSIPFVLQTSFEDEIIAIEALQNGADFFLQKGLEGPFQFLGFSQIINILISKRKLEQKLQRCEYKFQSSFELHSDGMVYVDSGGLIREMNQIFLEMTGFSEKQIENLSFQDIIPKEWNDIDFNVVKEQVFANGRREEYRRDYMRSDGSRLPISIRGEVVKNSFEEPVGMWLIVRDLSRD